MDTIILPAGIRGGATGAGGGHPGRGCGGGGIAAAEQGTAEQQQKDQRPHPDKDHKVAPTSLSPRQRQPAYGHQQGRAHAPSQGVHSLGPGQPRRPQDDNRQGNQLPYCGRHSGRPPERCSSFLNYTPCRQVGQCPAEQRLPLAGQLHIPDNLPYRPSFPRKRESKGCLTRMRRHRALPFWIPACAGMTDGRAAWE